MAGIGAVLSVVSSVVGAMGTIASGRAQAAAMQAQAQAAQYQAAQLDIQAQEEQAAAQREAEEYKHKQKLAESKLQARSASSGFSATDPTALALAQEIVRYGTYQQQLAMYGGTSRRAGLEAQAEAKRLEGRVSSMNAKAARKAAGYSAAGSIIGGLSSMARYG